MAQNLFPVFNVPAVLEDNKKIVKKYVSAPLWDFEDGDFVMNEERQLIYASGYDTWVQWCKKTALTQRWAHDAYSDNAGIEAEEALKAPDRKASESTFERTITEALFADPMGRTRQVRNFQFNWYGDNLRITFEVFGADGKTAAINTSLKI